MKYPLALPLALCTAANCQAGYYFIEPVFNTYERYESNLFLRPVPLQDNWITTLSPGINFGLRHETGELNSNFTWNRLFYTNQSELNIDEQLFSSEYHHKTDRTKWGLNGSYNNQSSLNTLGTVNGLTFSQVMSKRVSLAPTFTYLLNERSTLTVDYSFNKVTYEKNPNSFLANYDYHQASASGSYLYTALDKINMTLSSSLYKTPLQNQTTYNHVAQLGWQHSFSEQLVAYVSGGINYSQAESTIPQRFETTLFGQPVFYDPVTRSYYLQQQYNVIERKGFGKVFRASVQKSYERGSVSLIGLQNQTPTSQGLQTQTQLSISNSYAINDRWTSDLTATYTKYEQTGQQSSSLNRTFYSISPSIQWKWTPEINLGLSYTYRQQDFQGNSQSSQGNTVQLQLSYQPQINHQVK